MTADLLSPRQTAAYIAEHYGLHISATTVRRWVARGYLRSTRDGAGRVHVDVDDLTALFVPLVSLQGHD